MICPTPGVASSLGRQNQAVYLIGVSHTYQTAQWFGGSPTEVPMQRTYGHLSIELWGPETSEWLGHTGQLLHKAHFKVKKHKQLTRYIQMKAAS